MGKLKGRSGEMQNLHAKETALKAVAERRMKAAESRGDKDEPEEADTVIQRDFTKTETGFLETEEKEMQNKEEKKLAERKEKEKIAEEKAAKAEEAMEKKEKQVTELTCKGNGFEGCGRAKDESSGES